MEAAHSRTSDSSSVSPRASASASALAASMQKFRRAKGSHPYCRPTDCPLLMKSAYTHLSIYCNRVEQARCQQWRQGHEVANCLRSPSQVRGKAQNQVCALGIRMYANTDLRITWARCQYCAYAAAVLRPVPQVMADGVQQRQKHPIM